MKEIIEKLQKIDTDFYNGAYTFGDIYELKKSIEELLNKKQFN